MADVKADAIKITLAVVVVLLVVTSVEVARKYGISSSSEPLDSEDDKIETGTIIESNTVGSPSAESMMETPEVPKVELSEESTTDNPDTSINTIQHSSSRHETDLPEGGTTIASTTKKGKRPPHIVFVLADDYGHSDIGYHGSWIRTPVMDRLAAEGVKLENYYVQPICSPTRSQLMSGRYQIHTGLQHEIIEPTQPNGLPLDSPTLAEKLKESGYSTHMVGKWHLGFFKREYLPHYRGFDTFYGKLMGHGSHYTHKHGAFLDLHSNDDPVRDESGHYSTHLFTEKAIDVVRAHDQSKPLFLYLSYQAVHGPIQVPQSYKVPYNHIKNNKRRTYAGMVTAMDEGVGNLTEALKQTGMWDDTVLVFSSDNGGRVRLGASNYPLRGEKHSLWEGGVKSIGFVSGGRLKQKGAVSKELMHVSDWFPTFVRLAGGDLSGTKPLDGVDQWDAINEGKAGSRKVLLHNIDPKRRRRGVAKYRGTFDSSIRAAVRVGDLKLITGNPDMGQWFPPLDSDIRETKGWNPRGQKNLWLFNITADPNERTDLSKQRQDDVMRMLSILAQFQETAVEPVYPKRDRRARPSGRGAVWGPWL